jgi:hypothetical protein
MEFWLKSDSNDGHLKRRSNAFMSEGVTIWGIPNDLLNHFGNYRGASFMTSLPSISREYWPPDNWRHWCHSQMPRIFTPCIYYLTCFNCITMNGRMSEMSWLNIRKHEVSGLKFELVIPRIQSVSATATFSGLVWRFRVHPVAVLTPARSMLQRLCTIDCVPITKPNLCLR